MIQNLSATVASGNHAVLGLELAYWQETTLRVLGGLVGLLLLTGGVVYWL